jgi:DNA sulfur modification protein DndD
MLIKKLSMCDVGVFEGLVELDLAPRQSASKMRPVVLLGGLNGSGKTTVLNAIRLAFYGRLAAGAGLSQKAYEQYLLSLIHSGRAALVPTDSASVTIEFQHAQLGVRSDYKVVRSWTRRGDGATELLQVFKGNEPLAELSQEQIQSLLNQLVPIGIADLFFFDGEKISDLATEDRPHVLSESVKRLVGLQLVERLQSDLLTYVRQSRSTSGSESERELARAIAERNEHTERAKLLEIELADIEADITRLVRELEAEETELSRMGGAWATDRTSIKAERARLAASIRALETSLRESLAGAAPLALLGEKLPALCSELRQGIDAQSSVGVQKKLVENLKTLRNRLKRTLPVKEFRKADKVVDEVFGNYLDLKRVSVPPQGLDLGGAESRAILDVFELAAISSAREARQLGEDLGRQRRMLEGIDQQIARAPDESVIAVQMERIKGVERKLIEIKALRLQRVRDIKATYWSCFDMTRTIRRMEEDADSGASDSHSVALGGAVHKLLDEFSLALKEAKLAELAQALQASFRRLARKSDLISTVEFNPESFAITIQDKSGSVIPKKKLSAGEQQVFAIAVLDALLTCSGRSLPLVIDTPLGRLDSKHRERLVKEYFPRAAHQVVVLSTDTEVDQRFYEDLAPHLSHSYHLQFDEETGSTRVESGYFWRTKAEELRDAA